MRNVIKLFASDEANLYNWKMPLPLYLIRSFQDVYLRHSTGGYYTRARFPVQPRHADHYEASGKPCFLLSPVFRLFLWNEKSPSEHEEILSFPHEGHRERISVGHEEMYLHFERMPQFRAVQNSDLEVLLAEYSNEGTTSDPQSLARVAHRYALTMSDSQARCLLELMARVLDAKFP